MQIESESADEPERMKTSNGSCSPPIYPQSFRAEENSHLGKVHVTIFGHGRMRNTGVYCEYENCDKGMFWRRKLVASYLGITYE